MRILVTKPVLPWPPNQGTRRVTVALLSALSPEHDVTLAAPALSPAELDAAAELSRVTGARVVTRLAPNRRSGFHRVLYKARYLAESVAGGHSPRALYATPPELLALIDAETRERPVDLAIIEYWYGYRWLTRVRAGKRVLLAHDAEFAVNELARRAAGGGGSSARSIWAATEARREAAMCRAVDGIWTLTAADARALGRLSGVSAERFRILPFGIDTDAMNVGTGGERGEVLFFGSFAADFNRDALLFLIGEIAPRLRELLPDVRIVVAGGGLPGALEERCRNAGFEVRGPVVDVAPLYASASVVLIPLRFGGGLRIRMLEAMAASRAIVGTPVAVAGIEGTPGEQFIVAEGGKALAEATARLLRDRQERERLGQAARALAVRRYSLNSARGEVLALVQDAIGGTSPPDSKGRSVNSLPV